MTSEQISSLLDKAARKNFPGCETAGLPVADGGEGTVDAVIAAVKGTMVSVKVQGPLLEEETGTYGMLNKNSAIIEMAAASGLPMVPSGKRNPLKTNSVGTGELIKDALDKVCRQISIALGGSATNDGGMGAMTALGVKFFDQNGKELAGAGEDLAKVSRIDLSGMHPAVKDTQFTVMCDVTNPLCGETGATYTFGMQKGADTEKLKILEAGMVHYAGVLKEQLGVDAADMPGAGAAGGLGFALKVFLNATLKSGIETVMDLIDFDSYLEGTDLVVTGEGRMDWQSAYGKVPSGVGKRCKAKGIPVIAIVGGMGKDAQAIYDFGVDSIIPTANGPLSLEFAIEHAEELYADVADRMFRMLKAGMALKK